MAVTFNTTDLEFVLQQILMAEAGQPPVSPHLAFGLREVSGTNNNSVAGQGTFGAADEVFPRVTDPVFRTVTVNIDGTIFDPNLGVDGDVMTTTYASTVPGTVFGVNVVDPAPRVISNLIADQTANNPAALEAQAAATPGTGYLYQSQIFVLNPAFDPTLPVDLSNPMFVLGALNPDFDPALPIDLSNLQYLPSNTAIQPPVDAAGNLFIPNVTPDAGLSAPFNSWFTFFGQFFDHGLDLVTKGGSGTVFIPLQPDDPLITVGPDGIADTGDEVTNPGLQFMVLTRATNLAGADGLIGTFDDIHENTNTTTPFVDQNQTYSSHPSHQVFLRDYITGADGLLHSTGLLLTGADGHSMATWADVKANALKLGILLTDADVGDVPLLATDAYGNVMLGVNGFAQVVVRTDNGADSIAGTNDDITVLVEGTAAGLDLHDAVALGGTVVGTGHAFLNDISPIQPLDAHYIAGDGRANENIALTAIHDIFHAEHNRQIEAVKAQIQAELDVGDTSFASNWVLAGIDLTVANGVDANGNPVHIIQADEWNGERLFQVAKFSTEIQYQHLVFEEFARKVSPNIHLFGNNDIHLDPAITAEFAHAVYRFGHSMLDETVNRYEIGADGTPVIDPLTGQPVLNAIGLIDAFLNPLEFAAHGATATGEIVLGSVNQVANEIDEFVTGALRNNLLGLPLDLAAINLARGRDTGVAPLNLVRNQIFTELNTGGTQDTTLKPYASWDEFGQFLKHAGSLVNFVAAYGTHASIIGADTLLDKRAAALTLVANAVIGSATFDQDAYDFMHSLGAYANDINNLLAVHAQWSTGSITGLDTVDLWIGGLAEKQNLFGGLLGSTFNFIFENQMEAIQDGDRLYYLPRIEGLHFGSEIENNTFADLIMRNTGTHHLSANIFMTPEYVVEAGTIDPLDPSTWLRNAVTGNPLVEVLTDDYVDALFGDGLHHAFDTQVHFLGDDNFFGNTMVLGGTEGRDVLIAGQADDDTVYGDGGDDWLDGGNGNDVIFGGAGDDIIRDSAGDDIMHAGTGNDNVDGGLGDDIIFGEDGNDLLRGGNSILGDEISGGIGNDIIFGDEGDDALIGNEGDDWIEGGTGGDGLVGDIGAPTGQVPLYAGNDVLDGGEQGDKMVGFSGDDIMLGLGGFDKFTGLLGFDWGSFENEQHGVSVDMTKREFIPNQLAPAGDAVRDFWIETEAVSGSAFDDVLGGTETPNVLGVATPDTFNELVNVDLITGLDRYFPGASTGTPVAFSTGNIMLGGGGNDFIEGRSGDDIIDGDARLHVELTRDANGNIFPDSQIVREILTDQWEMPTFGTVIDPFTGEEVFGVLTAGDIDTAVYADVSAAYQISLVTDADGNILFGSDGNPLLSVTHATPTVGVVNTGTDTLHNIERLQFADGIIDNPFNFLVTDFAAQGTLTIDNATPAVGQILTATAAINDVEGVLVNGVLDAATAGPARIDIPQNELFLQWQYQIVAAPGGTSQWVDIAGATGDTFAPTDFYVGFPLRVVATFIDGLGVKETVFSAPTAILVFDPAVNHAPTVVTQVAEPGLFDTSARQDQAMTLFLPLVTTFTDDQTPAANLIYTATLADGSDLSTVGLTFATTPDGAGGVTGGVITGTPPAGFFGTIDIRVKAADAQGLAVTDVFTINVLPQVNHAPVITSDGANATAAVSVAENSTAVTTVTATDADALTTLTFSVAGGPDADKFTINTTTGALSFLTAPDFEAPTDVGANNIYDVVVQVSDGNLSDTQAIAVTVTNVGGVTITGTNAANTVNATTTVTGQPLPTNEEDIISGIGGADSLSGLGGNDTIIGGTGNDLINGGAGNDVIIYTVGDGVDAVFGGTSPGAGAANTDVDILNIRGTVGGDTLAVIFNGTVLTGAAGGTIAEIERVNADLLGGSDTLSYGTGTTAAVTVNLAAISASGFALITGIENVTGGSGADVLTGDGLDNALNGGAGNDTLNGGFGNDTLVGGAGVDWVSYAGETDAMFISLATGSAQRDSAVAPVEDALVTIENVTGGLGSDSITGNTGSNLLDGGLGTGNDTLDGGSGSDTLIGGDGNDSLVGGVGVDSIDGGAANDGIVGGAGNDALSGGLGDDSFTYTFGDGVDATDGGGGIDTLNIFGTAAANTLTLSWNGSALTAFTGGALAGIELVTADLFDGTDTLSYAGATAAVNVDLAAHTASGFTSILGIERVTGGSGNDTLTADTAAADTLSGGAGNDTLTGTGNDVLIGGAGDDTYFANLGDIITEAAGGGNDTVITSSATFTLAANVENLQLVGAAGAYAGTGNASANILSIINSGGGGTVTLNGGGGNDTLNGGANNDGLNGDGGDDRLVGGAGDDAMTGGTGNDVFVFGAGFGNDAITDFDANPAGGQDLLDVSALGITAATFAASVTVTDLGADTLITIGGNTIHLVGVSGVGANIITQQDFIL